MKKKMNSLCAVFTEHRKTFQIMRVSLFLILISALQVIAGASYSQSTRLSLNMKNSTVKDVLGQIEEQSEFYFLYNNQLINVDRKVNLEVQNEKIEAILSKLFDDGSVNVLIRDRHIILTPSTGEASQQQQKSVSGKVTDSTGGGLPGVSIVIKGTSVGAITDVDGNYRFANVTPDATLVFSFVGMKSQEVKVGSKAKISVTLEEESIGIDEVVAIGYGTQKKGDVTSSVTSVKSKDFTLGSNRDASELIKGKVAGLNISNGSGNPTSQANIMLRGISTLKGGTNPLILINGIAGGLNTVAPEDIESIDVLKDASAAAIYGTRGANGVILITTKAGKRNMKPEVNYSAYVSTSNFAKKADFLTADDLRTKLGAGVKLPFADEGATTNWLDQITQTGLAQNHNVSLKAGNENSNYAASVTYNNQDGVFKRTNNQEMRATFDANQYFLNDKIKINLNFIKGLQQNNNVGASSSFNSNIYRQALIRNPTAPITKADGTWMETSRFQYYNPLAMIQETAGEYKNEFTKLSATASIKPIAAWETNLMVSTRRSNDMNGYSESKQHFSNTMNKMNGVASKNSGSGRSDDLELTSRYNQKLGEHSFSVLGGYSYEYNVNESVYAYNYDFPTDAYSYNNLGAGAALLRGKAAMGSGKSDNKLIGFFGRVSYNFADRFNLLASMRHEGSSKFGANYKWGNFPSVSAGWTISNESFMKGQSLFNNLKLRAGYGITGVIPSESYASLTLLNYEGNFFSDGKWVKGLVPASNPNPDLRWEKSKELNIGLDFSLLKNRLSGTIDVYKKNTSDLLWDYNVPQPPYLFGTILANVGEMSNKGIELALTGTAVKSKDFEWTSSLTLSHNENKLISLANDFYEIDGNFINTGGTGDPISFATHRLEPGRSFGNFWGLKSVDVTHKGDEFGTDGSAAKPEGVWVIETPEGERKVLNTTMYTDEYKQYLGNGIPKINAGWTNSFRYKNIDLSLVFNGAFGFQILNFQRMFYENPNINYNMLRSAFDNVYGKAPLHYNQTYVSYYIENGDYVKLDNVTLGYNFDVKRFNFVKSLRVYATGQNLFCITGYKGLDPEIERGDIHSLGDDSRDKYPSIRIFTFGLNVTF